MASLCAYVVVYILFMASPCMHIFCCIHESRDIYLLFPRSSVGLLRGGGIEKYFTWEAPNGFELWTVGSKCNVTECLIVITIWPQVTIMHSYMQKGFNMFSVLMRTHFRMLLSTFSHK